MPRSDLWVLAYKFVFDDLIGLPFICRVADRDDRPRRTDDQTYDDDESDCCIFVNFHWPILSLYHTTYALSISLVGPPLL